MTTLTDAPELAGVTIVDRRFDQDDLAAVEQHDQEQLRYSYGDRPNLDRSCRGKVRFGRKAAERAVRRIVQQSGEDMHAYACDCGSWHVGHTPVVATNRPDLLGGRQRGAHRSVNRRPA